MINFMPKHWQQQRTLGWQHSAQLQSMEVSDEPLNWPRFTRKRALTQCRCNLALISVSIGDRLQKLSYYYT